MKGYNLLKRSASGRVSSLDTLPSFNRVIYVQICLNVHAVLYMCRIGVEQLKEQRIIVCSYSEKSSSDLLRVFWVIQKSLSFWILSILSQQFCSCAQGDKEFNKCEGVPTEMQGHATCVSVGFFNRCSSLRPIFLLLPQISKSVFFLIDYSDDIFSHSSSLKPNENYFWSTGIQCNSETHFSINTIV